MSIRIVSACCFVMLALVGCSKRGRGATVQPDSGMMSNDGDVSGGDDMRVPGPDSGLDLGMPVLDAGRDMSTVPVDMGSETDPCASDDATLTVGCHGGVISPSVPSDSFGGLCTPNVSDARGSCTAEGAFCDGLTTGICLQECTFQETYTSTSDCPLHSRCFSVSVDMALCFPDCNTGSDCSTGVCDDEGSCLGV